MATTRALSQEDGNLNKVTLISSRLKSYSDIDLLFTTPASGRADDNADVYKKIDAAAVKQSVKTILLTNHFEKPFLPLFGANLNSLLFELADPTLAPIIERQIIENLSIYEPRAKPLSVVADVRPDSNEISITVTFMIVSTNEQLSLTTTVSRLR